MGHPSNIKPRPAGATTRRGFFQRSGSAAVAVAALPSLSLQAKAASSAFQHGVASGDPLTDGVILWTRVTPPTPKDSLSVAYVVARDTGLSDVVQQGSVKTNVSKDYTVKIDLSGLQPGTTYYYQFSFKGELSPIGRTRTLPVGTVDRLRFAVVSCSNYAYGYFNAYQRIAEQADLDAVIHLGDYLYEYGDGEYGDVRKLQPSHEILTLDDYRARHALYKTDPNAQALHRQHPMIAIWDDHETANDAWAGGAENHDPATEGEWPARVAAALQAYYEWMPVRVQIKNNLKRDNRRLIYGNLVDLYMLEERLNARSQQIPGTIPTPLGINGFTQSGAYLDETRTLLGDQEEQWLVKGLRKSGAQWRLLGQGVMFAQLKLQGATNAAGGGVFLNPDQWDGYQPARNRIYSAIQGADGGTPISNLVVLTGDIHSAFAAELTPDPNNPDTSAGGYDKATGQGSVAVEFVGTSVTSPGIGDPKGVYTALVKSQNPHMKHVDLNNRGYMLLDVDRRRVVCEYWTVPTVTSLSSEQTMSKALQVSSGSNHLTAATQTTPRTSGVPPLAP